MKMKKNKFLRLNNKYVVLALVCTTLFVSCKKEKVEQVKASVQNESSTSNFADLSKIQQRDGMLEFATQEEFYNAMNTFGKMTSEQRILWGEQNNFRTQQIIFDEICKAEDDFDAVYYEGIPDTTTEEELALLGKSVAFSDMYTKYLQDGLIKQTVNDSGYSFHLDIFNPMFGYVFNLGSKCIVNDTLYYMNSSEKYLIQKKYTSINDIQDIERNTSLDDRNYLVFYFYSNNRSQISQFFIDNIWTQTGIDQDPEIPSNNGIGWTWYYDSANERFRHYVNFYSSVNIEQGYLHVNYYTESLAQYKGWFKWRQRNKYRPIDYHEGKWDYYYMTFGGGVIWNSFSGPGYTYGSPFIDNPYNMNNQLSENLEPTGTHLLTEVSDALEIENMYIHGYFIGSTGNYHTKYYH